MARQKEFDRDEALLVNASLVLVEMSKSMTLIRRTDERISFLMEEGL